MPTMSKSLTTTKEGDSELLPIPHPGETILEDFLKPLGKTPYWLAKGLDVPYTRVDAIVAGRRGITADTAIRLSRFLGCSVEFWLGLQSFYDIETALRSKRASYDAIKPSEWLKKAA